MIYIVVSRVSHFFNNDHLHWQTSKHAHNVTGSDVTVDNVLGTGKVKHLKLLKLGSFGSNVTCIANGFGLNCQMLFSVLCERLFSFEQRYI